MNLNLEGFRKLPSRVLVLTMAVAQLEERKLRPTYRALAISLGYEYTPERKWGFKAALKAARKCGTVSVEAIGGKRGRGTQWVVKTTEKGRRIILTGLR